MDRRKIEDVEFQEKNAKVYEDVQAHLDKLDKQDKETQKGKLGNSVVKKLSAAETPINNLSGLPFPQKQQ